MWIGEVPEIFRSDDILYHYCSVDTALNFILKNRQLRLSHRKESKDPIEHVKPWFSYSGGGRDSLSIINGRTIQDRHLEVF
jgi:hypothetical protein